MPEPTITKSELERIVAALERAEERIASLEHELAHAERLATLGTLVGAVAHEFNNILTPVMSYAQLALSAPEDGALTQKALDRAYRGAERAARVSSTMLGFSRNSEEPSACLVTEALDAAIETARLDAYHERVELVREVPDDLCAGIACLALQQVLINLLLNARRALGSNGGTITVRAERSTWNADADESGGVHLHLIDDGCGIDDKTQRTLFTPFKSAVPNRATRGTGLGLAICKRLIESAGGRIGVASQVGVGTTFTIDLPEGDASLVRRATADTSAA